MKNTSPVHRRVNISEGYLKGHVHSKQMDADDWSFQTLKHCNKTKKGPKCRKHINNTSQPMNFVTYVNSENHRSIKLRHLKLTKCVQIFPLAASALAPQKTKPAGHSEGNVNASSTHNDWSLRRHKFKFLRLSSFNISYIVYIWRTAKNQCT